MTDQNTVPREDFEKMSGDLSRAKNLLLRLWDKHPAARAQIEGATGSWFEIGYRLALSDRATPAPAVGAATHSKLEEWQRDGTLIDRIVGTLSDQEREIIRLESALAAARAHAQPVLASLSDEQRVHLAQAADMLDSYGCDQRKRGNDSTGEGAAASAYVLRQMLATTSSAASEVKP